jgi:uncharacterized phiE125 gp8 family phage protein
MSSILLLPPAVEPLTLAEAKLFLRVEHTDDDALISALIAGARIHLETDTRRALIVQTWRAVRDAWPADGRIAVTPAPLRQVVAARVYDFSGATQAVDPQAFALDKASSVLGFAPWSLPQPGRVVGGIEIDVETGYGATAADVPEPLRQAIRLLLAHWYENRAVAANGSATAKPLPANVAALLAPFRGLSL